MPSRSFGFAALIAAVLALAACAPASAPAPAATTTPPAPNGQPLPARLAPSSTLPVLPSHTPGPSPTLQPTDTPAIVQASTATKIPPLSSQGLPVTGSTASADVVIGQRSRLGSILVDSRNMSLYILIDDQPGTPTCYGECARAWPPFLASGRPIAGDGLDAGTLGTVLRTDGATQITYDGWPLYYSFEDTQPGDVKGQGVGGIWFVISPEGKPIR